ncbi:alkaline phosphatase D family protein [Sphingomonas immobilis]|uniref:Alkaline phosphatase D family protein n=1 Tax=Sphingomonas immobilis TaxID=3063997 RepID=A0ABT8ZUT7_9SPHN|nr:alkaline phosphatase D family protein [Sphingomonas sp. CA1-15]MDO7840755.1 alkaline phosphatase D family protein [Sphingomonas sp. CA1-15]
MILTRREAIAGGVVLVGLTAARASGAGRDPFSLGVASGDPWPDGMVLWTRLAPEPLSPDGGMPARAVPVRWEISESEHFAPVRSGTAMAEPAWGHSVHVELTGLRPGRPYWYRFIADGVVSPVGRTRTAPASGTSPERLRLCFGSCQKYEAGYYAAWRHAAAEDPDLIVFLGDYIYEGDPTDKGVRKHLNAKPRDLAGYRVRYATYKLDPWLQAAHAAAPWVSTWDDHEVENNYTGDFSEHNDDRAVFLKLRAAAYKAYYEHMPVRRAARPVGSHARLYRTIGWGDLAQLQVIDDRQYRTSPPCQAPGATARHLAVPDAAPDCPERNLASRSMLGWQQEDWLAGRLRTTRARWNFLTQQTLMLPLLRSPDDKPDLPLTLYNTDRWDGFPATRARILRHMRDARTPNPVILSGDIHAFVAGDHADPDRPERIVASEFVGGSITSLNHAPYPQSPSAINPGFRYSNIEQRGYGRIDLTRDRCEVTYRGLADARDERSSIADIGRFVVEAGKAGLVTA